MGVIKITGQDPKDILHIQWSRFERSDGIWGMKYKDYKLIPTPSLVYEDCHELYINNRAIMRRPLKFLFDYVVKREQNITNEDKEIFDQDRSKI